MKKIAVLGLGRFGMRLSRELAARGVEVIAIDRREELRDEVSKYVARAVSLDVRDEQALREQGLADVDTCVVAIGENFESTLLTTLAVKNLVIQCVIARAQTALQAEILRRVGADQIIQPESEAAIVLGRKLANPHLRDFLELDGAHAVVEINAPARFHGHTLAELRLRKDYRVNLVTIKRPTPGAPSAYRVIGVPGEGDVIQPGDVLVLVGDHRSLASLPRE